MTAYRSDPARTTCAGWVPVGPVWVSLPLEDDGPDPRPTYARMGYRAALQVAKRLGGRLPTRREMAAIADAGLVLSPVALPDAELCHVHGVSVRDEAMKQHLREVHMQSLEWMLHHDAQVAKQLLAWNPERQPLMGCGKQWIRGEGVHQLPPGGTAWLMGWPHKAGVGWAWTQTGLDAESGARGFHDDLYADYSSIVIVVRDTAPELEDRPTPVPSTSPAPMTQTDGERALERALGELGQREVAGPRANPRISEYLAGCVRHGAPLGLVSDEIAWCAAFAGWCEQGQGHAWRAAVAELVADAVAAGTWREVGYQAKCGDLPIWKRAGGDPRHGGPGHVGRLEVEADADTVFTSIEGNHDNQVARVKHSTHEPDLVGWIARA